MPVNECAPSRRPLHAHRQQTDLAARLPPGLRQCQHGRALILFHGHFAALNRTQFPALIVLADLQPQCCFRRLVEKNPETFIAAGDGADQGELGGFDLLLSSAAA